MVEIKEITSLKNAHVKAVVDLREKKSRDETGLTIVEGLREATLAQRADVVFKEIYFSEKFLNDPGQKEFIQKLIGPCPDIFLATDEVMEKISFGNRQEGIVAVCAQPQLKLDAVKLSANPLLVIVEAVEKPGNLGAILRTADAVGVDGLIVCDPVTDIYNPNVIRASLGTIFTVPVIVAESETVLKFLKEKKIPSCATLPQAGTPYAKADLSGPLAVVMGSEEAGLSEFWQEKSDTSVYIPMKGKSDSLNVSVSAAVVLYEALRQRTK